MTLKHTRVIDSWEENHPVTGRHTLQHTMTYQLSINPFTRLYRHDLPAKHELEDWEEESDTWIRSHGNIYNVREFCTVGMPHLPGPMGGAQLASDGYVAIAGFQGELYGVRITESKPFRSRW